MHPISSTKCYVCGATVPLSDHHLLPRSEGGSDHPINRVTLCLKHHDELEGADWIAIQRKREQVRLEREDRVLHKAKQTHYRLKPGEYIGNSGVIWGRDEISVYSRTPSPEELEWLVAEQKRLRKPVRLAEIKAAADLAPSQSVAPNTPLRCGANTVCRCGRHQHVYQQMCDRCWARSSRN